MSPPAPTGPGVKEVLLADHLRLEALLEQLLEAFRSDAREDTQQLWRQLEDGLATHLTTEERWLLPGFRAVNPAEVALLQAEHVLLRRRLAELGAGVDLKAVRLPEAQAFVDALRAHARREDALLYRWADADAPGPARAHVLEVLATR